MTLIDIVNENDEVIGQDDSSNQGKLGFISRNVIVFIQDQDGLYVICKRAANKDVEPNCYDASVAGFVNSGETYDQAAQRELWEELRVTCKLKQLDVFYHEFPYNDMIRKHWTGVYYGRTSDPITLSNEHSGFEKKSFEELRLAIERTPENFSVGFRQEFKRVEEKLRAVSFL